MTVRRFAVAALVTAALVIAGTASSATQLPVDNTQVVYDTLGQRLDAHDGSLLQTADGTIYLYGTSYGCGFTLGQAGPYCGVRVYTTHDLRSWTPAGAVGGMYAFNHLDGTWQAQCTAPSFGCYRPHVVKRSDGRYVMWIDVHGDTGYRTLVADSPAGPFVDTGIAPLLAVHSGPGGLRFGDEDVTIAPDGRGYLTYTVIDQATNSHTLVIEELDPTLTNGTGRHVVIDTGTPLQMAEAPALFYGPNSAWYLIYSNPAKPYTTTGTGIVNGPAGTPDPIGDYTSPRSLNDTSCSGQPTGVWRLVGPSGVPAWVYGTDRWVSGQVNQARSNNYYGQLAFSASGGTAIDAYTCQSSWALS